MDERVSELERIPDKEMHLERNLARAAPESAPTGARERARG